MPTNHTLVWIDHTEAKLFEISPTEAQGQTITDAGNGHNVQSQRDHVERAQSADEHRFMMEVAAALANSMGILIVGPGQARTELASFLATKFPEIAEKVWANQAIDHPTDPQLIAHGRKFFHEEERMR